MYAAYALEAAYEAGLNIPEDISIVGFDNTNICDIVYPKLTSIYQPIEDIAKTSFQLLEDKMADGYATNKKEVRNIVLAPGIIVRGTYALSGG